LATGRWLCTQLSTQKPLVRTQNQHEPARNGKQLPVTGPLLVLNSADTATLADAPQVPTNTTTEQAESMQTLLGKAVRFTVIVAVAPVLPPNQMAVDELDAMAEMSPFDHEYCVGLLL
jgi:hypothetical protein